MSNEAGKKPTVFISYSHKDEKWKNRLVTQLKVLLEEGLLDLWDDRQIGEGDDWEQRINDAMNEASVAVLLVSPDFLTSKFILRHEVSRLLQRRDKEGLAIFPVIVEPCPWEEVDWLMHMQVHPPNGEALSLLMAGKRKQALTRIAKKISERFKETRGTQNFPRPVPSITSRIDITRLPDTSSKFFGRKRELKMLNAAWEKRSINILTLIGSGGVGKSALVNHWLRLVEREEFRGAESVYAWSFYSQRTTDEAVSADLFIDTALRWFGDANPTRGSSRDKGERLAELVKARRTLLLLDGLEPLQYPPGREEGRLKDQTLRVLLRTLAAPSNPGLCVVSTRLAVSDLEDFYGSTAQRVELGPLSPADGARILKEQGVKGPKAELERAAEEFQGHSLALILLGSYLRDVCDGNVRRRGEVEEGALVEDTPHGYKAEQVMASYERWFGEGPELDVLRMLGLFTRLADDEAIAALRTEPVIPGLTDALHSLSERKWQLVLAKLRRAKLLAGKDPERANTLDAHPLIREYFGQQLKQKRSEAWREGNNRLYQHLRQTAKAYPETMEEMAPLYAAVSHACKAGRHQEALDEVYLPRIFRGDMFFSTSKLGAFSAELATLANFFAVPWHQPVAALNEASKAFVLHEVGFDLRALGRLVEAARPMQASLAAYISLQDWVRATIIAGQLSHTYLVIGDLARALSYAEECVRLADLSNDAFWQARQRTTLARTLHYAGRLEDAEIAFREAEEMHKKTEPQSPTLYSLWGSFYCDFLLGQGEYPQARKRTLRSLRRIKSENLILMIALDYLTLGRVYMLRVQHEGPRHHKKAERYLKEAVDKLRQAGRLDHLPRGLMALACLRLFEQDFKRARRNLAEALSISKGGNMKLHQADCHLEYARLYLAEGEKEQTRESRMKAKEQARESWVKAKEMIERIGYHRRDKDVAEIERQLGEMTVDDG